MSDSRIRQSLEEAAQTEGIRLEVVKLQEAKKGFVLLPKRWVEGTFRCVVGQVLAPDQGL